MRTGGARPGSDAGPRNLFARALYEQLEQSPLERGLYLESVESSRTLRGDVYAVVDYPFAVISEAFARPESWCEALILHLNVKYCQTTVRDERTLLSVAIGKKIEQPLDEAHRIEFTYSITASTPDYMAVGLYAKKWIAGHQELQHRPGVHEVEHDAYLTMKRREYLRQQMIP